MATNTHYLISSYAIKATFRQRTSTFRGTTGTMPERSAIAVRSCKIPFRPMPFRSSFRPNQRPFRNGQCPGCDISILRQKYCTGFGTDVLFCLRCAVVRNHENGFSFSESAGRLTVWSLAHALPWLRLYVYIHRACVELFTHHANAFLFSDVG